jgi:hypothetical protein
VTTLRYVQPGDNLVQKLDEMENTFVAKADDITAMICGTLDRLIAVMGRTAGTLDGLVAGLGDVRQRLAELERSGSGSASLTASGPIPFGVPE